jgi:hypothetical protein
MSSPPPPWESHPPLEDEGFYGAATDPDPDADTGPVHVVTPTDEDVAHVEDVAVEQSYYPPPVEDTDFEETRPVQWRPDPAQAGFNSTPESTTASSRLGAVSTATNPSLCFQMLALSVSPGNTTPANRAP